MHFQFDTSPNIISPSPFPPKEIKDLNLTKQILRTHESLPKSSQLKPSDMVSNDFLLSP